MTWKTRKNALTTPMASSSFLEIWIVTALWLRRSWGDCSRAMCSPLTSRTSFVFYCHVTSTTVNLWMFMVHLVVIILVIYRHILSNISYTQIRSCVVKIKIWIHAQIETYKLSKTFDFFYRYIIAEGVGSWKKLYLHVLHLNIYNRNYHVYSTEWEDIESMSRGELALMLLSMGWQTTCIYLQSTWKVTYRCYSSLNFMYKLGYLFYLVKLKILNYGFNIVVIFCSVPNIN